MVDPKEPNIGDQIREQVGPDVPPTLDPETMFDANRVAAGQPGEQELEAKVYSKDYWDIVFEQLGRRKLFKVGLAILALLYAIAIYAPFLANDRPYVIEMVDLKGYKSAAGSMRAVAREVGGLIEMSDEDYAERLKNTTSIGDGSDADVEGSSRTRADAIHEELGAAELRVDTILLYLPPEDESRSEVEKYRTLLQEAVAEFEKGDGEAAKAKADEAQDLGRGFRRELAAWDPTKPDKEGKKLLGAKRYPLLESISAKEMFMMALCLMTLLWPLWNRILNKRLADREKVRAWRKRKVGIVLALSALWAMLWTITPVYGKGGSFDTAPFKGDLHSGGAVLVKEGMAIDAAGAESDPVWAPIPYGYAEGHGEEMYRNPTWHPDSEIDENGAYVRGPRAPKEIESADGVKAENSPVVVLPAEPDRNSAWRHIAGTDSAGRDFLSRMVWGGRISLTVGILSAVMLTVIGVVMGSIAGYFGGWIDIAIMRLIEIIQSIPAFFLILAAMSFVPQDQVHPVFTIVIVIALIRWTGTARLVRGEFLRLREQEFVLASRALGFSNSRTIFRHVLPNAMSPVLVSAAFSVASGILTESAVSYLGFGAAPPEASWGGLVNDTKNADFWWIQVFPGILIFITVTCYNLVGDAVRDALDPKMKL